MLHEVSISWVHLSTGFLDRDYRVPYISEPDRTEPTPSGLGSEPELQRYLEPNRSEHRDGTVLLLRH